MNVAHSMTSFARPTARGDATRRRESFESFETSYAEIIEFDVVVLEFELGIRSRHDVARERRGAL